MIAYQELSDALFAWRVRQGISPPPELPMVEVAPMPPPLPGDLAVSSTAVPLSYQDSEPLNAEIVAATFLDEPHTPPAIPDHAENLEFKDEPPLNMEAIASSFTGENTLDLGADPAFFENDDHGESHHEFSPDPSGIALDEADFISENSDHPIPMAPPMPPPLTDPQSNSDYGALPRPLFEERSNQNQGSFLVVDEETPTPTIVREEISAPMAPIEISLDSMLPKIEAPTDSPPVPFVDQYGSDDKTTNITGEDFMENEEQTLIADKQSNPNTEITHDVEFGDVISESPEDS